ncbi:phosphodiester glycosidase family protein [Flavilitoribacter nigricans]|uniref:Phosphodiester glycosidase domain-containing protein n=1 Tax=Flavilitoribacter nigricans (strain ATCC 23147 / DSM 23189 / NBRC 102662 / NCIMB 1420 / SS-2) TaxID=1122177 RepID=A0A2D0NH65_FLAN2|nr:phosphodiester glycosidase family protein [Flavilitoribacter nigricans]PHN07103.1 hypothetical protein CRP01_07695 [Flavilitoribacter nigricans DSM 23189 = NBRC 102662]
MTNWKHLGYLAILTILLASCGRSLRPAATSDLYRQITYRNLQTTSFFDSPQKISIAEIPEVLPGNEQWGVAYATDTLIRTSDFAQNERALVAINGGFFNMQEGGSVTYLEVDGQVINFTVNEAERWAKDSPVVKGALIVTGENELRIEPNRRADYYQRSPNERAVLITGPLLLQKGRRVALGTSDFINKRHPRSCVCTTTDQRILLVAVDGRNADAAGMSLPELQEFLLLQNCREAINLDGGGSTALWMAGRGIINSPSDKTGERPVANILYLNREK